MPMLADIDDPPKARMRGILLGFLWVSPAALLAGWLLLPYVHGTVRGGSDELDARLRAEDAYMDVVCHEALVVERDKKLCGCALSAEYPSLDCRAPFTAWSLARQSEQCRHEAIRDAAIAYCACIDAVAQRVEEVVAGAAVETPEDTAEVRQATAAYARCSDLSDAFSLPELEQLMPPDAADG